MTDRNLSGEHCAICARELTRDEVEFYDDRCEACERAAAARIDAWLDGRDDPFFFLMLGRCP